MVRRDYLVVDTMLAASVVVTPVVLATNELNALEGMPREVGDYSLLLIPSKVPAHDSGCRVAPVSAVQEPLRAPSSRRCGVPRCTWMSRPMRS